MESIINKINTIDFTNLNIDFFMKQLQIINNNPEQFESNSMSEPYFKSISIELKKYKSEIIALLYDFLFNNDNSTLLDWDINDYSYNKKLKLLLIPFISPLSIDIDKSYYGYKKNGEYINLSIFSDFNIFKNANLFQIKTIMELYSEPNRLVLYCIQTINKFLKTFKKDKTKTLSTYSGIKPELIYSFNS